MPKNPPIQKNTNPSQENNNQPSSAPARPVKNVVHRPSGLHPVQKRGRPVPRHVMNHNNKPDKKTPFMLKLLSWLGLILLCFVIGYLGTTWLMEFLNTKLLLKPENRIENQEDFQDYEDAEQKRAQKAESGFKQVSLNLHYVSNGAITEARKSFPLRTPEDNIKSAFDEIISMSSIPDSDRIKLLHVFRNDDTVFFDVSSQFETSLNLLEQHTGLLLLTGIVRTMTENFSPVSQVRFLVDSKLPKSGGSLDLSTAWKLPDE